MLKKLSMFCGTFVSICFVSANLYAFTPEDIIGVWKTEKDLSSECMKVEIYRCGDEFCGKIIWLSDPKKLDVNNKDEARRSDKLLGKKCMWGFVYDGDEWKNGNIYGPKDGKTYSSKMILKEIDVLKVKGCIGFICLGTNWYRDK